MKASHKRVIEALLAGGRLEQSGTVHGTYNVKPKNARRFESAFSVQLRTIDEMRRIGLLTLTRENGRAQLVAAEPTT